MKTADILLAFEPAEAVRCLPYLKEGGTVIVSSKAVKPVTDTLGGSTYEGEDMIQYLKKNVKDMAILDGEEICLQAGSAKVLNVALLGAAAASGALDISTEEMEKAVISNVKERFLEMNKKALALGKAAYEHADRL